MVSVSVEPHNSGAEPGKSVIITRIWRNSMCCFVVVYNNQGSQQLGDQDGDYNENKYINGRTKIYVIMFHTVLHSEQAD